MSRRETRQGLTLVELLVVVAIIGTLLGLLLPAVQASRESARRMSCQNNLKQIALGCLAHEQALKFFPCGGWGWGWLGDPDMGFADRQPGGWIFNILPYVEESQRRSIGAGETFEQKKASRVTLVSMPLVLFLCPTRSRAGSFSYPYHDKWNLNYMPTLSARGDYAINAGSQARNQIYIGPATIEDGLNSEYSWPDASDHNGISYQRSQVKHSNLTDGTTVTYLAGEKYLNPRQYYEGWDGADNSNLYTGYENDNHRDTSQLPATDWNGLTLYQSFGSAHAATFNMSACDGSVRAVSYGIDATIHRNLGSRADGTAIASDSW
jgi:prepilin-type N-terminal cleavage/methylation domain-containing protein